MRQRGGTFISAISPKKYPRWWKKIPLNIHWSWLHEPVGSPSSTRIPLSEGTRWGLDRTASMRLSAEVRSEGSAVRIYNFDRPERMMPWL